MHLCLQLQLDIAKLHPQPPLLLDLKSGVYFHIYAELCDFVFLPCSMFHHVDLPSSIFRMPQCLRIPTFPLLFHRPATWNMRTHITPKICPNSSTATPEACLRKFSSISLSIIFTHVMIVLILPSSVRIFYFEFTLCQFQHLFPRKHMHTNRDGSDTKAYPLPRSPRYRTCRHTECTALSD